jgi:hypothetical protein
MMSLDEDHRSQILFLGLEGTEMTINAQVLSCIYRLKDLEGLL